MSQISFHRTKPYLAVQSHDRFVEIFRIRTEEEVRKKQAKKKRLEESKGKAKSREQIDEAASAIPAKIQEIQLVHLFTPHVVVRASGKVRSFEFGPEMVGSKGNLQVCCQHLSAITKIKNWQSYLWP